MSLRVATVLIASGLLACIPRGTDPNVSDLDGDGIVDAWDQCMADPEDLDGFEDEDGCAEAGEASHDVDTPSVAAPDIKTKETSIHRSKKEPLRRRNASGKTSRYQPKAWGVEVDENERAALVFGFGIAWIKAGSRTKRIKGDVYQASFSPDGRHVGVVGANAFLVIEVATGKQVGRFSYAKGTARATETKKIYMRDGGEAVFFDGCKLRSARIGAKSSKALSEDHCGDRPLVSSDGNRWYAWHQEEEQVAVFALDVETGEERRVLGGSGDAPGLSILLASPDGRYICFSRHEDGSELTCRDLNAKVATDLPIWKGPTDTRATFSANGMLGFGAGPLRSEREFFVVDLDDRKLRRLGSLGPKEEWISAVGETGFVASGGSRLRHFDVEAGTQLDIDLGKGEWEGFASIPGSPGEFIVGKERRATRDLFRVVTP